MEKVTTGEESYASDICYVSMSSTRFIRLVCRAEHGSSLMASLQNISESLSGSGLKLCKTSSSSVTQVLKDVTEGEGGEDHGEESKWQIWTFTYSDDLGSGKDLWKGPITDSVKSKLLTVGQLLIGQIMCKFGKNDGWSLLVNGSIKNQPNCLWFVRDQNKLPLYPIERAPFAGFETSPGDCAVIIPSQRSNTIILKIPHLVRKSAQRLERLLFSCNEHYGVTCDHVGWPSINIK